MSRAASLCLLIPALSLATPAPRLEATAVFAGGSFWALEAAFDSIPGVDSAVAGYARPAGDTAALPEPAFDAVAAGNTPWVQAVRVHYDPGRTSYNRLADVFWRNIDPTRADGQFTDAGRQYRTILFCSTGRERKVAENGRAALAKSKRFAKPIVTEVLPPGEFRPAEPEHQDYARRNGPRYKAYVKFSGREEFLRKAWGGKKPGR